jgi:hypothetical protein
LTDICLLNCLKAARGASGFENGEMKKLMIGFKYIGENFSGEFSVDDVMKGWIGSQAIMKLSQSYLHLGAPMPEIMV